MSAVILERALNNPIDRGAAKRERMRERGRERDPFASASIVILETEDFFKYILHLVFWRGGKEWMDLLLFFGL